MFNEQEKTSKNNADKITNEAKASDKKNNKHKANYKGKCGTPSGDNKRKNNHPSWYAANSQLLTDVASLPFSNMLGNTIEPLFANDRKFTLPGIMVITLRPSIGGGFEATDAPTVAARNIYTFVRHANSGSANYEAPDLLMMIIARLQAEVWLNAVERAYGAMRLFSTRNRYYAETIVQSMGFSYQSFIKHQVAIRAYINQCKARLNTIKIPKNISLASRWNWLTQNYFVDDSGSKPQTYIFKWDGFFAFAPTLRETGSALRYELIADYADSNGLVDFDNIVVLTETLLSPLLGSEDIGIMSGDIMKAYKDNVSVLALTPEDYVAVPVYEESALAQIHNMYCFSPLDSNPVIYQNEDGVIIDDQPFYDEMIPDRILLDLYKDNVTPEDAIVATRLISLESRNSADGSMKLLYRSGSEYPIGITIYTAPSNGSEGNLYARKLTGSSLIKYNSGTQVIYPSDLRFMLAMSCFDWHPRLFVYSGGHSSATNDYTMGVLGDLENYSSVSKEVIGRMNTIAVLSELNVNSDTTFK